MFAEGFKFFPIPIVAEPRNDIGSDTIQKDRIPDYCLEIKGHGFIRANGWIEFVGGELFQAASCLIKDNKIIFAVGQDYWSGTSIDLRGQWCFPDNR